MNKYNASSIATQLATSKNVDIASSFNYYTLSFENKHLFLDSKIDINHSLAYPLYITSNKPLKSLTLNIGGITIIDFPLDLCNKLNNFEIKNELNKSLFHYKLIWKLFELHPLVGPKLINSPISFIIKEKSIREQDHINNNILDILEKKPKNQPMSEVLIKEIVNVVMKDFETPLEAKLYVCCEHLNSNLEKKIENNFSKKIIQFNYCSFNIDKFTSQVDPINLPFTGSIKGLFFEINDINAINEMTFTLNNSIMFEFSEIMIMFILKHIKNDLYYLAFDNLEFYDMNWVGSLYLEEYDKAELKIIVKSNLEGKVYALNYNKLNYSDNILEFNTIVPARPCNDIEGKEDILPIEEDELVIKMEKTQINNCPICRCNKSNILTKCKHQYCEECLDYIGTNDIYVRCPLCAKQVVKKECRKIIKIK